MSKLKKVWSAVIDASSRPAESWRFLRQAVRELHVVLQGITTIVGDFETRLDRLEKAATQRPPPRTTAPARRKTAPAARKTAPRKRARKSG